MKNFDNSFYLNFFFFFFFNEHFISNTKLLTISICLVKIIINLVKYLYYNTYSIMYLQCGFFVINLPELLYNIIMNLQLHVAVLITIEIMNLILLKIPY